MSATHGDEARPDGTRPDETRRTPSDAPEVAVLHLRASYDRRVFTDVSFVAAPGAVTVVSGPSGVGKTTLVRILLGRQTPDRGEITVAGRSIIGASRAELEVVHARTGYLFAGLDAGAVGRKSWSPPGNDDPDDGVAAKRSVGDNVREVAVDHERASRALADFGLADDEQRRAGDLDLGARRRLGLARVFAAGPRLVLLDDPVAALDPAARDAVVDGLARARSSCPSGPPTVVLACHDLATTRALADHLVTLVAGRTGTSGPPAELLEGVEDDHGFATKFAVGGKRIAAESSEALDEHQVGVVYTNDSQRLFVVSITVLGLVFLVAIALVVAFGVSHY